MPPRKSVFAELRRLALVVLLATLAGWLSDRYLLCYLITALLFLGYYLFQLRRMLIWLHDSDDLEVPYAKGLWGEIFDAIYGLKRRSEEEQLRLRADVDHLERSFSAMFDAVVLLDAHGRIDWCNAAAEHLLGTAFPRDHKQFLLNLLRAPEFIAYYEGGDFSEPVEIRSPVNPSRTLTLQLNIFGKQDRLLFARDVTEFRQLDQMRKDFIGNVSHELRTPLTVINGYLETLHASAEQVAPRWQKPVEQMLTQAHRMESLIKDLIWLSKLESVPMVEEDQPVDVDGLIREICQDAIAASNGRQVISSQVDSDVQLLGSHKELYSAFSNLAMNAVRYGGEGSEIRLCWNVDDDTARFSVQDNGPGIEAKHLARLTERFYRVETSRSVETGGTGLGLAIVKHVLIRHDAELIVSSEPGRGSQFTCVFPGRRIARKG